MRTVHAWVKVHAVDSQGRLCVSRQAHLDLRYLWCCVFCKPTPAVTLRHGSSDRGAGVAALRIIECVRAWFVSSSPHTPACLWRS